MPLIRAPQFSTCATDMSIAHKSRTELLTLARTLVQPLSPRFHKGQAGKIAVIGGSEDYTGAPFFAAHSAATVGADLSHVVCELGAGTVIKGYSPDLMVHPYLQEAARAPPAVAEKVRKIPLEKLAEANAAVDEYVDENVMPKVLGLLERTDVVVLGPGFGRDHLMLRTLVKILEQIKVMNKPVVLDADALFLVAQVPLVVKNYKNAILTPNVVEFGRLAEAVGVDPQADAASGAMQLSKALGGVTVVRKGGLEIIAQEDLHVVSEAAGLPRRVGGQGDTLTGAIATFVAWAQNYHRGLWDEPVKLSKQELRIVACFAAANVVREASRLAFASKRRAMQTSDVHGHLGAAYEALMGGDHGKM